MKQNYFNPRLPKEHCSFSNKHNLTCLQFRTTLVFAGKVCHTVDHIYLTSCIDQVCPAFRTCLAAQSAVGFDDDNGLDLERSFEIQNDKIFNRHMDQRKVQNQFNVLPNEM